MHRTLFVQRFISLPSLLLLATCLVGISNPSRGDEPNFNRDVRPIISNFCIRCHGPDEEHREADLRLDTFEGATSRANGDPAIVPGDAAASSAMKRILSDDPDERMPPPSSELHLKPEQIEIVRQWINSGAKYETHWAFRPLNPVQPPETRRSDWIQNPVDAFVLDKLENSSIAPSPEASRATWLRRASLDLLGLPPDWETVASFERDKAPDAYERAVDRLLASPRYGERWGRHWLDQARYADTNGYTVDSDRTIWPYRDWVIRSVNDDKPFDEFTIEQLAGDLLPNPTQDQLVATGFHRNTLVNQEGGTDAEQFRNEAMVDRVNTTGAVWLGLTVGCAQCHNHKYDPLSQKEFYQLFAYFNSDQDVNTVTPTVSLPTPEQTQELTRLDGKLDELRKELSELKKKRTAEPVSTESNSATSVTWTEVKVTEAKSATGAKLTSLEDGSWLVSNNERSDRYTLKFKSPVSKLQSVRLEAFTHESLPAHGPGTAKNGNFVLAEIELNVGDKAALWTGATADHSQVKYPVASAIDGDKATGWAINVEKGNANVDRTAIFVMAELATPNEPIVTVQLQFSDKPAGYNLGRFRVSVSDSVPAGVASAEAPELVQLKGKIDQLEKQKKDLNVKIPSSMVMKRLAKPRETFVHIRGDFLRHGEPVEPAPPLAIDSVIHSADGAAAGEAASKQPDACDADGEKKAESSSTQVTPQRTRLDLARWLVDRRNPLVPRVAVNRVWSHFFPRGLVETENDFGIQGTAPSHPELLDWLAVHYRDGGWSLKELHRTIVLSATYRQSSKSRSDLVVIDPNNKLLARQSRLRVDAEIVRDCCLQVSGLLTNVVGGPSVFPPQPDGVYAFTQNKPAWPTSTGEQRYRRGLYTFFRRSAPYPMLTTFDTPRFDTVCTARIRSNTPLQSLTLSNDAAMFEMARAFGQRLQREAESRQLGTQQTIEFAYGECFARRPNADELKQIDAYFSLQQKYFAENAEARDQLLERNSNNSSLSSAESSKLADAAAWIMVGRVLFNLDEFVTRD